MTAFNPPDWSRRAPCKVNLGGTLISGGPHANRVVVLSHDNFITNCPEAITQGGAFAMQGDGADVRASTDAAGANQIPCYVRRVSLNATPANSEVFMFVQLPSVENGVEGTIYLHWLYTAGTATPEAEAGTYGRNATFSAYLVWLAMQDDSAIGDRHADYTGTTGGVILSTLYTRATGGSIDQYAAGSATGSSADDSAPVALVDGSTNYSYGWFLEGTGGDEYAEVVFTDGATVRFRMYLITGSPNNIQLEFNTPVDFFNRDWARSDGAHCQFTIESGGNGRFRVDGGAAYIITATNPAIDYDRFDTVLRAGSGLSHMRISAPALSVDLEDAEEAMLRNYATFSDVEASEATATSATLTVTDCPAGYRLDSYYTTSGAEPHLGQFDVVASTSAGTNLLTNTVTGFDDLFVSLIGPNDHRPYQGYIRLLSTGTTVSADDLLQPDPVFDVALIGDVTEGVEYTVTTATKTLAVTNDPACLGRTIYSSLLDDWQTSPTFTAAFFPWFGDEREWFTFVQGWDSANKAFVRSAGLDRVATVVGDTILDEFAGQRSQSGQGNLTGTTCYYSLAGGAATQASAPGQFNFALQTYQDGGTNNRGATLQWFGRQHQRRFAYDDLALIGRTLAEPIALPFSLNTSVVDPNVLASVATIDSTTPYTGMGVTVYTVNAAAPSLLSWIISTVYVANDVVQDSGGRWFRCTVGGTSAGDDSDLAGGSDTGVTWEVHPGEREVDTGNYYAFDTVVDGNSGTPIQVHEFTQRRMLFDGADNLRVAQYGDFATDAVYVTTIGVYVDNLTGNARFTDLLGVERTPPAVVTLEVTCLDRFGDPIETANVRLEAGAGGPTAQGTELLSGLTNASGVVQTTYEYTGDQPLQNSRARRSTTSPLYASTPVQGTIIAGGFTANVTMVPDE